MGRPRETLKFPEPGCSEMPAPHAFTHPSRHFWNTSSVPGSPWHGWEAALHQGSSRGAVLGAAPRSPAAPAQNREEVSTDTVSSCGVCKGSCCHTPSTWCGGTAQAPFYRTCSFSAPEHLLQLQKRPQPTPGPSSGGAGSCSLHTLKSYWDHPVNGDQSETPIGPAPNCLGPVLG